MEALALQLRTDCIYLQTGEFIHRINSDVPVLASAIHQLYGDFPLIEDNDFSDFHIDVRLVKPISRWFRTHVAIRQRGRFETPAFNVEETVAQFEWSLNRCIYSQHFPRLLIHAGVLEKSGKSLIIVGESGAGKSTLSALLCLNGWRLLSDELTIISPVDGSLRGLARPVALKNEAIDLVASLSDDVKIGPVSTGTMKGDVAHMRPPQSSILNVDRPARPSCFVFIEFRRNAALSVGEVPKARAFMDVAQHAAINYSSLGKQGFETLSHAIDSSRCYRVRYGSVKQALDLFCCGNWETNLSRF